jgi:Protein of unknown function (DUF3662)/FHA domain
VSILRNFERRLEGMVEGLFATVFRTGLQPVELGRRLLREMEAGQTVGVRGVWVPNRYTFQLSPHDRERFAQAEHAMISELRQLLREGAAERGWSLVGPPEIVFEMDESLGKGQFRLEASLVEGEDTGASAQIPAVGHGSGELILLEDGRPTRTYPLDKNLVTIGRLPECDVVLTDAGASRRHAEIRREDGGFVLADLGSTNGTMVNETQISEQALEEGDRITIGRTILEFRGR